MTFPPRPTTRIYARLASAQRRIWQVRTLGYIFALQEAHDDGPTGVCNHSDLTTVYSYVLHAAADGVVLYVVQGRPCSGAPRVRVPVPLGDACTPTAAARFFETYPSATKRNAAPDP